MNIRYFIQMLKMMSRLNKFYCKEKNKMNIRNRQKEKKKHLINYSLN